MSRPLRVLSPPAFLSKDIVRPMAYFEAAQRNAPTLDLDLVRDFLMQNPDFVREDSQLLAAVASDAASGERGNVVAIGDLARERLLRETRSAQEKFTAIVETARANYESQIRVQEAIIAILDARDPQDLGARLSGHVAFALAADACVMAASQTPADAQSLDRMAGMIERLVPAERPVYLGPVDRPRAWLYGDRADAVRSEALARLEFGPDRRVGVLALGSSDIDAFRAEYGAELVVFFARVLERVLDGFVREGLM
jgi:uncharacterized protein